MKIGWCSSISSTLVTPAWTVAPNDTIQKVEYSKWQKGKYDHDHSLAPRSNVNMMCDLWSQSYKMPIPKKWMIASSRRVWPIFLLVHESHQYQKQIERWTKGYIYKGKEMYESEYTFILNKGAKNKQNCSEEQAKSSMTGKTNHNHLPT